MILKEKIERSFALTKDLVDHLDEASLELKLPGLPSNSIAAQLWCVVGARESYLRAVQEGDWQGFSCSLKAPLLKNDIINALNETFKHLGEIDFSELTDVQANLAFDLLEHEIMHHGQLVRYIYGNRLTFPPSWNKRYTV